MGDIIAAFATPPGVSGLQVLRVAGEGAAELTDRIFTFGSLPGGKVADSKLPGGKVAESGKSVGRSVKALPGYRAAFGYVHALDNPAEALDQCVITRFRSPHSYTGEEQVEISIHGGQALRRMLLDLVLQAGARPAEAGEFSKRAFLNGKMDLAQAESVMELIQADTERQQQAAVRQLEGATRAALAKIKDEIYALLSALEVDIEYPEYEDFTWGQQEGQAILRKITASLESLAFGNRQGRILRDGMQVVLIGEPNVGKSSMLNALAGEDRAIVTEVAGTTRDIIELQMDMAGIPLVIYDTAGIRESVDPIEKIGVDRTLKKRREADLLMLVVSAEEPEEIAQKVRLLLDGSTKPFILLCNKIDLAEEFAKSVAWQESVEAIRKDHANLVEAILVSAKKAWGIEELKEAITSHYESLGNRGGADLVLTSARQQQLLEQALATFRQLEEDFTKLPADILATGVRQGLELLGEITGEDVSEQMVEEIFARFCIGK